jgi:hypothetical protein
VNTTAETRIRDLLVTLLSFGALGLWLWLWWRRLFAVGSTDSLLLWQLGAACAESPRDCYNGFYPFGYPLLLGQLFPNDGVYGPTLINMGACTVLVATFGMIARQLRVGLLATIVATAVFASHPSVAYAATNPGPDALALLLLLLGAAIGLDPQIRNANLRIFVASLVAGAGACFRSELFVVVPIALSAVFATGRISRRELIWGGLGALIAAMPQTFVQLSNGLMPWSGSHGFTLWASQHPELNWNRMHEAAFPQSLLTILGNDPVAAVRFYTSNLLSLMPWVIGAVLPAISSRGAEDRGDKAIAYTAIVWALWAAGDDGPFGTLILGPLAALQTARLCVDGRHTVSRVIRWSGGLLLVSTMIWTGINLYEQTQDARRIRNQIENLEAMLIDSGATDARRVFITNPTRYLPTLSPHVTQSPGGWLQLPGAVPSSRPWCTDTIECFVRELIAARVQFVMLDPTAALFSPEFARIVEVGGHGGSPHPCLDSSSSDGVHTVLYVSCVLDPVTGEFRQR